MLRHTLMATTAAAVLTVAGLAQAQQSTPRDTSPTQPGIQSPSSAPSATTGGTGALNRSMLREIDDAKASVQSLSMSAKDLADADIYGSDGKKIGEVNKILADSSNQVKAVTLDVGGFLGMGAREVVFPLDKLQKGSDAKKLQTSMTKAEIEKLDEWADNRRGDEPRRSTTDAPRNDPPRTAPAK